jgi:hypothetical protein
MLDVHNDQGLNDSEQQNYLIKANSSHLDKNIDIFVRPRTCDLFGAVFYRWRVSPEQLG